MSSVEMMRQALIDSGVPANKVAEMSEQQLANECKARNIKLQEGLNNNANWGKGDETSFTTTTTTQSSNKATEKPGFFERILSKFDEWLTAYKESHDINDLTREVFTQEININIDPSANARKRVAKIFARADLKDVQARLDQFAINIIEETIPECNSKIKSLKKDLTILKDKMSNTNSQEEIKNITNEMSDIIEEIEYQERMISYSMKKSEQVKKLGTALMEDLNKTATLQEREAVLNKEEHQTILALYGATWEAILLDNES